MSPFINIETVDDFIKFVTFIWPEKKGDNAKILKDIERLKNETPILANAIKNNEGKNV